MIRPRFWPQPPRTRLPVLTGWRPAKLPDGDWGARHDAAGVLPSGLVGRRIVVTDRKGRAWTAVVLEVVERTEDSVLVRDTPRFQPPAASAD